MVAGNVEVERDDLHPLDRALDEFASAFAISVGGKLDSGQQFGGGDGADRDVGVVGSTSLWSARPRSSEISALVSRISRSTDLSLGHRRRSVVRQQDPFPMRRRAGVSCRRSARAKRWVLVAPGRIPRLRERPRRRCMH